MSKPVIAIDIDDVLAPFRYPYWEFHNNEYGANIDHDSIPEYFLSRAKVDIDPHEIERRYQEFVNSTRLTDIEPLEGAVAAVAKLSKKYDPVVITARQDYLEKPTRGWLDKHFGDMTPHLYFAHHAKGGLKVPKSELCNNVGAEILIEDNLDYATECAEAGINVLLFGDYVWNQTEELAAGMKRVLDWDEVLKELL